MKRDLVSFWGFALVKYEGISKGHNKVPLDDICPLTQRLPHCSAVDLVIGLKRAVTLAED